jgi:GT2 family glycosyltransferase
MAAEAHGPVPAISVVIPVLDGAATLGEQLQALAGQTYQGPWEVVVADNGSSDGTVELVRAWSRRLPCLRLVDASDRVGTNHARNAGTAAARAPLLAYCDADDVAAPGWLAAMVAALGRDHLVGGRLDDELLNDPVCRAWRTKPAPPGLPRAMRFLPYATSANLGIRAEVLAALGGWDEGFQRGGTEVELCWRAQLAGYRLGFAPDAVMGYRYRSTRRAFAYQLYRYGRGEAQLYRAFRGQGMRRPSLARAGGTWAWILLHVPDLLRSPQRQGCWLRRAAFRLGRLHGSVRFRTVCL